MVNGLADGGLALVPAWLFEVKGWTSPLPVVAFPIVMAMPETVCVKLLPSNTVSIVGVLAKAVVKFAIVSEPTFVMAKRPRAFTLPAVPAKLIV